MWRVLAGILTTENCGLLFTDRMAPTLHPKVWGGGTDATERGSSQQLVFWNVHWRSSHVGIASEPIFRIGDMERPLLRQCGYKSISSSRSRYGRPTFRTSHRVGPELLNHGDSCFRHRRPSSWLKIWETEVLLREYTFRASLLEVSYRQSLYTLLCLRVSPLLQP